MKKTVALIIASEGFQPHEFSETKKVITQAGHNILIVSDKKPTARAADGSTTAVATTLKELSIDDVDGIVLIGGPKALEQLDIDETYRIIQDATQERLVVAAICIATRILAKSGVLVSKAATGWNGDNVLEELYRQHGVSYSREPVVMDGLFVTASGPDAAHDFAEAIVELL